MDSELAEQVAYWEEQDKIHMALRSSEGMGSCWR